MGDIVELPKRRSPKQLARAYMMGELPPHEYSTGGGIFRWMRLADDSKSEIASVQSLEKLSKLADLDHDIDEKRVMEVKLIPIKNDGFDNAVRVNA